MVNPIVSLRVAGCDTDVRAFVVPEMGLSSARSEMDAHVFAMTVKAGGFIDVLRPKYEKWVREIKEDEIYGDPDELTLAGYPCLEIAIATPDLLKYLSGYLFSYVIQELTWDGSCEAEYWLDDITESTFNGEFIEISGVCYAHRGIPGAPAPADRGRLDRGPSEAGGLRGTSS